MTQTQTLRLLILGALGAVISCDGAAARLDVPPAPRADDSCPVGTFRPAGLDQCVFPAQDINGETTGVSDDRCAVGQPAVPPSCVSDSGLQRPYLWLGPDCVNGYHFETGACNRNMGVAGFATGGSFVGAGGFGNAAGGTGGTSGAPADAGATDGDEAF
jgi:hypothetical protein